MIALVKSLLQNNVARNEYFSLTRWTDMFSSRIVYMFIIYENRTVIYVSNRTFRQFREDNTEFKHKLQHS